MENFKNLDKALMFLRIHVNLTEKLISNYYKV